MLLYQAPADIQSRRYYIPLIHLGGQEYYITFLYPGFQALDISSQDILFGVIVYLLSISRRQTNCQPQGMFVRRKRKGEKGGRARERILCLEVVEKRKRGGERGRAYSRPSQDKLIRTQKKTKLPLNPFWYSQGNNLMKATKYFLTLSALIHSYHLLL